MIIDQIFGSLFLGNYIFVYFIPINWNRNFNFFRNQKDYFLSFLIFFSILNYFEDQSRQLIFSTILNKYIFTLLKAINKCLEILIF